MSTHLTYMANIVDRNATLDSLAALDRITESIHDPKANIMATVAEVRGIAQQLLALIDAHNALSRSVDPEKPTLLQGARF